MRDEIEEKNSGRLETIRLWNFKNAVNGGGLVMLRPLLPCVASTVPRVEGYFPCRSCFNSSGDIQYMIISQNRGCLCRPQNTIILIMGTPHNGPPLFWETPYLFRRKTPTRDMEESDIQLKL